MSTERNTSDLIYGLPDSKILPRIYSLRKIFLDKIEQQYPGTFLDPKLLRHTVESYSLDMDRMKTFHDIEYSDRHKRAGFSMYWITRIKPIQLATNANIINSLVLINEIFAIHAGIGHLKPSAKNISKDFARNLLYTLHYRHIPPEALALQMYLLECATEKLNP